MDTDHKAIPLYGGIESRIFRFAKMHHQYMHSFACNLGLNPGQPPILITLNAHNGCTQKELCDYVHIRPASMTDNLRRMENAGMIARRGDPADMRILRVFLTEKGRDFIKKVEQMSVEMERIYLKDFSHEDVDTLTNLLDRILKNLSEANK